MADNGLNLGGLLGTVIVAGVAMNVVDRMWGRRYPQQPRRRATVTPKRRKNYPFGDFRNVNYL